MKIQRLLWLMGRIAFYGFLFLLLVVVIYSFSHDKLPAGLVSGVIFILVLYKGLICIKIPAYSVVVRAGKVVFFIPETTVRNRFDFVTRGQTIVELPHYGLLDQPYKLEIIFPDGDGGLCCYRLALYLDYLLEPPEALQRAFDSFVLHQERQSLEVRRLLLKSAAGLENRALSLQGGAAGLTDYQKEIVAELNLGLANVGLQIEEVKCTFATASTIVRFVAAEQETLEKRGAAVGGG